MCASKKKNRVADLCTNYANTRGPTPQAIEYQNSIKHPPKKIAY